MSENTYPTDIFGNRIEEGSVLAYARSQNRGDLAVYVVLAVKPNGTGYYGAKLWKLKVKSLNTWSYTPLEERKPETTVRIIVSNITKTDNAVAMPSGSWNRNSLFRFLANAEPGLYTVEQAIELIKPREVEPEVAEQLADEAVALLEEAAQEGHEAAHEGSEFDKLFDAADQTTLVVANSPSNLRRMRERFGITDEDLEAAFAELEAESDSFEYSDEYKDDVSRAIEAMHRRD